MAMNKQKAQDLISTYADLIDEGNYEAWPTLFMKDGRYHVTSDENHRKNYPVGIILCEDQGMMVDRIKALRLANIYEQHRYRHVMSPSVVQEADASGVTTKTSFVVYRTLSNKEAELYATGKYLDRIVFDDAGDARFASRTVVLDSQCVDTLMVIPL